MLLTAFALVFISQTAPQPVARKKQEAPPPVMYQFLDHITQLQPALISRERFFDKKSAKAISAHLKALADLSKKLPHDKRIQEIPLKIAAVSLQEHLRETSALFDEGRKEYAYKMFRATLDGCSQCHMQASAKDHKPTTFVFKDMKGDNFDKAEFLYAVRQYPQAIPLYEKAITSPQNIFQQETSIHRLLAIYVRHRRDPNAAAEFFGKPETQKALKPAVLEEVGQLNTALKQLASLKNPSPDTASLETISHYAKITLGTMASSPGYNLDYSAYVKALYAVGLLYDFLHAKKENAKPEVFYWLGIAESRITNDFFFSNSQTYLRQCIQLDPSDNFARRCYQELEDQITQMYTGSKGTAIPEDQQKILDNYKKMLPAQAK